MKRFVSLTTAIAMTAALAPVYAVSADVTGELTSVNFTYGEKTYTRQMEKLDRGLIAVNTGDGVYLGWRLLGDEGSVAEILAAPNFDVYKNGTKIDTVKDSTNYLDKAGKGTDSYSVAIEGSDELCEAASVQSQSYFDIKMNKPDDFVLDSETSYQYTVGDCSVGDLDGDGQYEIVVKWDSNAQDNSNSGITGNVIFDAYKMDGTQLWRIDMGRNVRAGAHYSQFLVYDFDMDGKAEMTVQTAPGSKDGAGNYVTEASADSNIRSTDNTAVYLNDGGYNLTSDEFLTVFNGETGKAVDTIYYPNQRISANIWGDAYGNRCDRFTAAVASMDGQRPYAVYMRGYYFGQTGYGQRQAACAVSFDGERLSCKYSFDTYDPSTYGSKSTSASYNGSTYKGVNGYVSGNEIYVGNGNHNCTVADVDNDGKDEVITGAICYEITDDDRLGVRWCTFMEHGDALHIGDYDPTHDGFEFFTVHEDSGPNTMSGKTVEIGFGMSVIDADNGDILFHEAASADTGRGVMANIGMGGYYQIWSAKNSRLYMSNGGTSYTAGSKSGLSQNFRIFWDGDLYDELLDSTGMTSWNGSGMSRIFNADGCVSINGTKAVPAVQADLFGDWREEVCYPLTDSSAIRVFTTTELTAYKLPTLMHDPVYRSGVAAEQTSYNQPPHVGFYLADDIFRTKLIDIDVSTPDKTEYNVGEALDLAGLLVTGSYDDGSNYDITAYTVSGFNSMAAGEQSITVEYRGFAKSFTVNVNTDFTYDSSGMITGYNGSDTTAVVPEKINGTEITGIAEGALDNTSIRQLYAYDNIETIEPNSFNNIKIHCYEGSEIHLYALENSVDFELTERGGKDHIINVDFSEDEYYGFSMLQSTAAQTEAIGRITYGVGGRNNGGGDGQTGFRVSNDGDSAYLICGTGRFATGGSGRRLQYRNAYMNFADSPVLSSSYDDVLALRFRITSNTTDYASVEAPSGQIDVISIAGLGIDANTWYEYKIIYHEGSYYRILSDADGNLISNTKLSASGSDTFVSSIRFLPQTGTSGNSYMQIDSIEMYTTETALSDLYIAVRDENKLPIEGASVTLSGKTVTTDADGIAEFLLIPSGIYSAEIKAEDYEDKTAAIAAYKTEASKRLTLTHVVIPAEGVSLPESAAAALGDTIALSAVTEPVNSTDRSFVWSSDNEAVATVDQNGNVTAVSEGKASITVTLGEFTDTCEVSVYDTSKYTQTPSRIEITGGADSAYIPLTGVNAVTAYNAVVYDQNDVEIKDAEISWSGDKANITNGVLIIAPSASEGEAQITASYGDVSANAKITLVSLLTGAEVYADTSYDEASDINLRQGTEAAEETKGDITYACGARSSGGKQSIGVWAAKNGGNVYMVGGSADFSSAVRGSYIEFNNAPDYYLGTMQYVLETDVFFENNDSVATLNTDAVYESSKGAYISGGTLISPASTGMDPGEWFHYMLVYADGQYTQYVFDMDNSLVSYGETLGTPVEPIKRMYFGANGEAGAVYLDNTRYYAKPSVMSKLTVKVYDTKHEAIENASVAIGPAEKQTNLQGRASFTLPQGVYNVNVSTEGNGVLSSGAVLDGEDRAISVTYDPDNLPTPTPGPTAAPTPTPPPAEPYYLTAMTTNGKLILSLSRSSDTGTSAEKNIYAAFYSGGRLIELKRWTTTSKTGISNKIATIPAGAEYARCYAWDSASGEPIAAALEEALN